MLTDFQNYFTYRFSTKLSIQLLQGLLPLLNYVATLPREIQKFKITAELLLIPSKLISFTSNLTKLNNI